MPSPRPSTLLADTGRALFGERWLRPLARALGKDKVQVQRWAAMDLPADHPLWAALSALLLEQATALRIQARAVQRWRKS